jgi:signal transduction histidine kinase
MQRVDAEGRLSGPAFEVLTAAARRRGIALEWVHSPEGPERALASGRVSLWPILGRTPEREKHLWISSPIMRVRFWLMTRSDSGIRSLQDSTGRRLSYPRGVLYERLARRYVPEAAGQAVPDFQSAMQAVCRGASDLALIAQGTGDHIFAREGGCEIGKVALLSLPEGAVDFGIGARREDAAARASAEALHAELLLLFDEGVLGASWIRWGLMGTETRLLVNELTARRQARMLAVLSGALLLALAGVGWQVVHRIRMNRRLTSTLVDLKEAQSMLVHCERMAAIGQMTAGIAHEINNPLAYVSGNNETLGRDFRDLISLAESVLEMLPVLSRLDPDRWQGIDRRLRAVELRRLSESIPHKLKCNQEGLERVSRLVLDLRVYARIDEAEWKQVDLEECLSVSLRFLQPLAREHQVHMQTKFGPVGFIWCSPLALSQAVGNLVSNAIQASPSSREVCVRTARQRDHVVITVEDQGCGMTREVMDRAFLPFFTTKPPGKGTGLGLSIARHVVQAHRGQIEVRSELGRGTTVQILVPGNTRPAGRGSPEDERAGAA